MMDNLKIKDRVVIVHLNAHGWIGRISYDSDSNPIYGILLENSELTPDGQYLARGCEIELDSQFAERAVG
jgi:hypothetical protein